MGRGLFVSRVNNTLLIFIQPPFSTIYRFAGKFFDRLGQMEKREIVPYPTEGSFFVKRENSCVLAPSQMVANFLFFDHS